MRISDIQTLNESLDRSSSNSVMLWESAGRVLKEAELTADQIEQLFKDVEAGATAGGNNRTMLGKGKDATEAVNKAWEDLKTKVQNSGPIQNVDNAYDQAVAKIEAGLGGPDNAVNKVIQKYRKFAKDHPIAQGFIYSALIAAAGISGAGLGGAAVLGLLKMTDKLLQGEKFSSAAYSGAKTGAMAYGASKIGDMMKGGDQAAGGANTGDIQQGLASDQAFQDRLLNKFPPDQGYTFAAGESGKSIQVLDATGRKVFQGDIPLKTMDYNTFADLTNNGQMATPGISAGSVSSDTMAGVSSAGDAVSNTDIASTAQQVAGGTVSNAMDKTQQAADVASNTDVSGAADAVSNVDTSTATDTATNVAQAPDTTATDAAANAAGGAGEITAQFTDGLKGTLTDVDGDQIPLQAYPSDSMQPRMPFGAEKVNFKYNGKDLTAYIWNRKAYVPDFDQSILTQSYANPNKALTEAQIDKLIFIASRMQLNEGPLDAIKGAAGKAVDWAKTKGHNLTTKVTADKLKQAWKKAGSPTDSAEVVSALVDAGADKNVVNTALQNMGVDITAPSTPADADGRVEPTMGEPTATAPDNKEPEMAKPTAAGQEDNKEPEMAEPTQDQQAPAEPAAQDQAGQGDQQLQGNLDVNSLGKLLPSVGSNPTPFKAALAAIKANKPLTPVMKAAMGNAFIDMVNMDSATVSKVSSMLKKVSV
jgi:hypothetical protein